MTVLRGYLRALSHSVADEVDYVIVTDSGEIPLDTLMGREISIRHNGVKACVSCGRKVNKLFQNGYCYPCMRTLAECDLCIVKPHECHFHLGTCRDEQFAETHCMIPHYVYLAQSSGVKVGLTRKGRQIIRWVDQGAAQSVLVAELPTRKQAGELEMEIAKNMPDKTNWRKMLQGKLDSIDLLSIRDEVIAALPEAWQPFILKGPAQVHTFRYPLASGFEPVVTSMSLDKQPEVSGVVQGAKAQYLLLNNGVFHVKKHTGYFIELSS